MEFNKEKILKEGRSVAIIILFVLLFRSSFYEPFRIPSGSMIPTLLIGDFILVEKFSFGFRVPFTDIKINQGLGPKYGDVVVFKYPKDPSVNYIKRVIGLPGDSVEIVNKNVYINGKMLKNIELSARDFLLDMDEKFRGYNFKFLKIENKKSDYVIQVDSDNHYKVNFAKIIIPKGQYFMMGDNRDYSYDSRSWGLVNEEEIRGKAVYIWFSLSIPIGDGEFVFRPKRIGKKII
jgi:signal peptidase I